jgi:hypothetical protein
LYAIAAVLSEQAAWQIHESRFKLSLKHEKFFFFLLILENVTRSAVVSGISNF